MDDPLTNIIILFKSWQYFFMLYIPFFLSFLGNYLDAYYYKPEKL